MNRNNYDVSFKVITIGNSGVGKTSILERFVYNRFNENTMSTVGLNNITKNITLKNGDIIQLKLFDTAGQEKFHSLSKSYFRNTDAVLFVYAINDRLSFEDINNWVELFENDNYAKIPLFLVENKNDLYNREVDQNSIYDFLEKNKKFIFKSISAAKNDNSINELFQELGELLYKNYKDSGIEKKTQKKIQINLKESKKKGGCCTKDDYKYYKYDYNLSN